MQEQDTYKNLIQRDKKKTDGFRGKNLQNNTPKEREVRRVGLKSGK